MKSFNSRNEKRLGREICMGDMPTFLMITCRGLSFSHRLCGSISSYRAYVSSEAIMHGAYLTPVDGLLAAVHIRGVRAT